MPQSNNKYETIQSFITKQVAELKANTPKESGALANSIKGVYDEKNNAINFESLDYFKFVDEGVNGTEQSYGSQYFFKNKMPPISAFLGYATEKNINPFAIAMSVYKFGIKPKKIADKSIDDNEVDKFATNITNAVWEDFAEQENKKNKNTKIK